MKFKSQVVLFVFALLSSTLLQAQEAYELSMEFTGLRSSEGMVGIRLFNADEEVVKQQWVEVTGTNVKAKFSNLEAGWYAVQFFHDENENEKMDLKWYGAPDEGYGTSNDVKGVMGPPNFEEQLFELSSSMSIRMVTFN